MAIVHPARVADDISRPQRLADAKAFHRASAVAIAGPCIVLIVSFALARDGLDLKSPLARYGLAPLWAETIVLATTAVCSYLFGLCAAGFNSYFFHPRRLSTDAQNRAVCLSYYSSAAWLLLIFPAIGLAYLRVLIDLNEIGRVGASSVGLLAMATVLSTVTMLVLLLRSHWIMLRNCAGCSWGRLLLMAAVLPIAWLALGLFWLAAVPGSVTLLLAMWISAH